MQYSDTLLYSQVCVPVQAIGAGYIQVLLSKFAAIASVGATFCVGVHSDLLWCAGDSPVVT